MLWLLAAAIGSAPARAQGMEPLDHTVCRLIERAAGANRLPVEFLTRLIWRESSFRPGAVSPAGARGIAQFMPGTAQERGLADPFDPEQAIPKAAHLLADLRRRFGNLGVAAAAYNAGPARVGLWLQGQGGLPAETRAYVRFVTRSAVEAWTGAEQQRRRPCLRSRSREMKPSAQSCLAAVADLRKGSGGGGEDGFAPLAPVGRAARRQFLEGDRAGLVRACAPELCRRDREYAADDHRARIAQPRHEEILSGAPAGGDAPGGAGAVRPHPRGRRDLPCAAELSDTARSLRMWRPAVSDVLETRPPAIAGFC